MLQGFAGMPVFFFQRLAMRFFFSPLFIQILNTLTEASYRKLLFLKPGVGILAGPVGAKLRFHDI